MRAAVFLNGAPDPPDLLRTVAERADLVIAADGGARHAFEAGIVPGLVVGDMDSLGESGMREAERRGSVLEVHPVRKDKMDGHLAILAARKRGATGIDLLCAGGGRVSALFAVPHLLLAAERLGLRATAVTEWGEVFVLDGGSRTVTGDPGDAVSIFPLTGRAAGVTLRGFAYPLDGARMEIGDTLGFHNELTGESGRVSVGEGVLLMIHEKEIPATPGTPLSSRPEPRRSERA